MPKALPTVAQIEAMTATELVDCFNALAPSAVVAPVTKFASRAVAVKRLTAVVEGLRPAPKAVKVKPAPKAKPAAKDKPAITMAERMRQLILRGKTNEQVWAIVQPEFGMSEKQRSYPAGQRKILAAKGLI